METYLNTAQAAELMDVNERTVRRLCESRQIKHERYGVNGRSIRLRPEWVQDYLQSIVVEPINDIDNKNEKGDMNNE